MIKKIGKQPLLKLKSVSGVFLFLRQHLVDSVKMYFFGPGPGPRGRVPFALQLHGRVPFALQFDFRLSPGCRL